MTDWLDDESMTPEETLKRFAALDPTPTHGPRLPADGRILHSVPTFSEGVTIAIQSGRSFGAKVQIGTPATV